MLKFTPILTGKETISNPERISNESFTIFCYMKCSRAMEQVKN